MCGIAGFDLSTREKQLDPVLLARNLLLEIEKRGRDAAGATWRTAGGDIWTQKTDLPASFLVDDLEVERDAVQAILHTRWATLGEPEDNANNHPIDVGGIIGVHNGMIRNHRDIFSMLGKDVTRFGQVDSEAIFALLQHGGEHPTALLDLPEGSMAIAWLKTEEKRPCLRLARGSGSPLHVGWTEGGSFVFASSPKMLRDAVLASGGGRLHHEKSVPEGVYLRVRNGKIVERGAFTPDAGSSFVRHSYSEPSPIRSKVAAAVAVEWDGLTDRARQLVAADSRYEQPTLLSRKRWSNGKGE